MNNKNRLSRKNYTARTISIFEVIGSYFVDTFYNHLYTQSQKNHEINASNGKNRSLTDEYKFTLETYLRGITKDHKYYEKAIKGVLEAYRTHTKYTTISMLDFINEILQHYLPEEHFSVLNTEQKFFFLNKIITQLVKAVITEITQIHYMRMVIDDHGNEQNVRMWMEIVVDMQIMIRETLFNEFIKQERGGGGSKDISETVDVEVVRKIVEERNKLWEQVQTLLKQKCELEVELSRAKMIVEVLYAAKNNMDNQSNESNQSTHQHSGEQNQEDNYKHVEKAARKKILSTHVDEINRQNSKGNQINQNNQNNQNNQSNQNNLNTRTHSDSKNIMQASVNKKVSSTNNLNSLIIDDESSSSGGNNDSGDSAGSGSSSDDSEDDAEVNDVLSSAINRIQANQVNISAKKGVRKVKASPKDDDMD